MFDIINVYRFSADTNISQFTEEVLGHVDPSKPQILAGDMNIDLFKTPQNHLTHNLEVRGFHQLVTKSTHALGGLIDHVYFYSPTDETSTALCFGLTTPVNPSFWILLQRLCNKITAHFSNHRRQK